ncbi:MAG: hypothetical protein M0P99_06435 [Candidatus Cloacimonetes bacterium]|jgi:hypothetical protein|nr:hypothetical protein [Candidatus Cloacimonadota bacterium]
MNKFFCNPSYPILFNNASSFADSGISNTISENGEKNTSAQELYDFFFNDGYEKQVLKMNKK